MIHKILGRLSSVRSFVFVALAGIRVRHAIPHVPKRVVVLSFRYETVGRYPSEGHKQPDRRSVVVRLDRLLDLRRAFGRAVLHLPAWVE